MTNIILIFLLIHYSYYLLFKPKNTNLSCGIFGWFGKTPKKFNKDKFDKLGIYNVERGRTSCGVSVDGDLFLGIDELKLYTDFIREKKFLPKLFPYALGHTRAASVGNAITLDNVHPFGFGDLREPQDCYEFIGVHNGTIYNAETLAEKYKVPVKKTTIEFNQFNVKQEKTRTKIDSELMLEILYTNKNYKVLSEYNGTAAMVFLNLNEPNAVYVWKGASKEYEYAKSDISEERPLFYYKETRNSLYISSIKDSLITIGGVVGENVFSFENNTIYKIIDGDVNKAVKIRVSRNEMIQREIFKHKTYTTPSRVNSIFDETYEDSIYSYSGYLRPTPANCKVKTMIPSRKQEPLNMANEKTVRPQAEYGSRLYFKSFRYFRNGHLVDGIYTWISDWGFFFIGMSSLDNATKNFKTFVGRAFEDGSFNFDRQAKKGDYVPFKTWEECEDNIHFFIQGVNVKDYLDYSTFMRRLDNYPKYPTNATELSHCSKHPVVNFTGDTPSYIKNDAIINGEPFTGTITPLGSEKVYEIVKGSVISYIENPVRTAELGFKPNSIKENVEDAVIVEEEVKTVNHVLIPNSIITQHVDTKEEEEEEETFNDLEQLNQLIEENLTESLIQVEDLIDQIESSDSTHKEILRKLIVLKRIRKWIYTLTSEFTTMDELKEDLKEEIKVKQENDFQK